MPIIQDNEFGKVTVRRSVTSRQVRIRVAPNGTLRATLPVYAPMFLVKNLLRTSRDELRKLIKESAPATNYENGMQIGKSHTLIVKNSTSDNLDIAKHGLQIIVSLPIGTDINSEIVTKKLREKVIDALKIEAKSYLPKRLAFLAEKYGYKYVKVRFSHSSGRWGSCSSNGTISLNIALMKLPFELIDYVLIHELSHIKQMNHGPLFWELVKIGDPKYNMHRKLLKLETPSI